MLPQVKAMCEAQWMSIASEIFNTITLATHDMKQSVTFYEAMGLVCSHGGRPASEFTTLLDDGLAANSMHVNFFLAGGI
jgi:hypothetical protein